MAEWLCADYHSAVPSTAVTILRYFNPVGAYPNGEIGDDPLGKPNNLMPCIAQVTCGRRPLLEVFGDDYPTEDGTGVRDYIHVCDLAEGHLAAISPSAPGGYTFLNLGTGVGISVLEMVRMAEAITDKPIPMKVIPRRIGDVAIYYADPSRAPVGMWTSVRPCPSPILAITRRTTERWCEKRPYRMPTCSTGSIAYAPAASG